MLTPPQAEVLASGLLDSGFNCILQMPTGSGKTWLAERAIESVLALGARAIYLSPLRALATELATRWRERISAPVGVFTGDFGAAGHPYPVPFTQARLLVMTPERLDACTRNWRAHWGWIPEVDLLVVDELHLLGESQRGARLEGALSRFLRLNPFTRVLGLSATLGNRPELADWLEGVEYVSSWRPVPLQWRILRFRKADQKPELAAAEVKRNIDAGGKSLVFVQSRRRAEELGRYLQGQGLRAAHHHAGLSQTDRQRIETTYRAHDLDVLVATATLEMGLNLPVRQVVLYDLQGFTGSDFQPLSTSTVWQRVGRAGRPGLDTAGEAVLLAPAWDNTVDRYARGQFEPIRSALSEPRALAEQILAEVTSGLARNSAQLQATFRRSLAAHQRTLPDVPRLIADMRESGMLRDGEDESGVRCLKPTRLGRIAVRHFLAPATVLLFHRVLAASQPAPDLTLLDLLIIAASSEDCEPVMPVDFEELDALADALSKESTRLLARTRQALVSLLGIDRRRLLSALKTAWLMRTWTRSGDADQVAAQCDCYAFEVLRLRESLERLLLAMAQVVAPDQDAPTTPDPGDEPDLRERVQALQQMVSAGLDEFAITLTCVPGVGPTMARRLVHAGISDIEALALAMPEDLLDVPGLSAARAAQWIAQVADEVHTRSAWRYRETGGRAVVSASGWPAGIDPYRLRRALDLTVVGHGGNRYRVTGGLEPHLVGPTADGLVCDCVDAGRGHLCKHILSVRLHRGDPALQALAGVLPDATSAQLNVFDLWFASQPASPMRRQP
jgi:helicase